jgi:DNA-binding LytR/AlgR family response regulator
MNCIVVDDEPLARKGMQLLIEQMPDLHLKGMFSNAPEADVFLRKNPVDILFLDIQMPGLNGLEFIKSSKHEAKVIITSAYPQFAVDAFEFEVCDYLVKPIRFERFYKAVNRIAVAQVPGLKEDEDFIFIRTERKYIRAHYKEIDYIEGLKDYVTVHCGTEKHMVATNLKTIQESLPSLFFLRINKSYIVNMSKVRQVENDYVMINGKHLPIGENFRKAIADYIGQKKVIKR